MRDVPARVVKVAARLLPHDRCDWGAAMAGELDSVDGARGRWRFALGCVWAALVATPHPDPDSPRLTVAVTFMAGVAGCLATTAKVLSTWPHAAQAVAPRTFVWFIASLATYLWIAFRPPRALMARSHGTRLGMAAGFALFLVTAAGKSIIDVVVAPADGDRILGGFLVVTVAGTFGAIAFAMARAERSFAAGVAGAVWAGLVCSILSFNADLLAVLTGFGMDVHMRHVMPWASGVPTAELLDRHIGSHLAATLGALLRLTVVAACVGAVGAAVGRWFGTMSATGFPERARLDG